MEDEDGTCLLDVLCDPQALNDFLHGTNELSSGDLLINPSSGEPSLFTDTPSPGSLLADDASSQDTPGSGCVDLSFLEEALLASPASSLGRGSPEELQEHPNVQTVEQQKEICDILQQSLQEADITEDTLALEAGLAETAETLALSDATSYLSKPLSIPGLISLPKDTQTAVEPPQPSLLAVGPGCPSLKPTGAQLMSLLPGNVFPTPPLEAPFSINSAQSTSMIIQKSLPSLIGRQMLTSTVRTVAPSGVMLQKMPQPIQPKLPVNIQPRLVQISPRPTGQKPLPGIAFISANTSQSVLFSPSVGPKQAQSAGSVSKPVSFNLVGQGGPIVLQPQDPFQGQRHFFLPSQAPAALTQSTSIPRCLFSAPSNQMSNKPNVESSQIVTVQPRQINFGPIFTSPTGQLTLKQGALLSGSLPIQSRPPTVFQMPAQIAGTYASQVQGQHDAIVHSAVGNQITLINHANMLISDMTTVPIVNGQPVMQSLPTVPPDQRALSEGPERKMSLISNPALLLPEKTIDDEGKVKETLQESRLIPPASAESPSVEIHPQPSPVSLHSSPDASCTPEPDLSLSPQLISQTGAQHFPEGEQNPLHQIQALIHLPQQYTLNSSDTERSLATNVLVQMDNNISTASSEVEHSLTALTASETFPSLCESEESSMTLYHHSEHSDILQSPIDQCSVGTVGTSFELTSAPDVQESSMSVALGSDARFQEGPASSQSPSSSTEKFRCLPHLGQTHVLTEHGRTTEPTTQENMLKYMQYENELTVPHGKNNRSMISSDQLEEMVHLEPRLEPLDKKTYSELQKEFQTTSTYKDLKEEKLTLAEKQQRVKQQMLLDHTAVLSPNTSAPFVSVEDAVRHLLPYHSCAKALPSQADFISVDKQFECFSVVLLKRIKDMLNKYRQLLLAESQQDSPSAEMVMLERLFLQSERLSLVEDKRRARREPAESILMSQTKSSTPVSSVKAGLSCCPSSPPSWTLQSDRPPGLKTYRSSSKGALRLTIKQESGSSASEAANAVCGFKRNYSKQVTEGKDQVIKPALLNVDESKSEFNKLKLNLNKETESTDSDLQNLTDSVTNPDYIAQRREGLFPEQCSPVLKRTRPMASTAESLLDDGELSEDLQSAIDSILELQRLQGSGAGLKTKNHQLHALEQAVGSMLGGQL
nr:glioma tumor suppressor candidate region gene 1 protein-like isoform X1 [Danio rerio]XP_021323180.1 glioma tumor suppressor candidate region gene 1 protein-like isoform X1 [Danio rerio]|eukprot:XP_005169955.1 glioma tumor suppressor candidate region gene 1 protein-like isoform X1 [Danio rerio]